MMKNFFDMIHMDLEAHGLRLLDAKNSASTTFVEVDSDVVIFGTPGQPLFSLREDVQDWCDANLVHPFLLTTGGVFLDDETEAALFKLVWGHEDEVQSHKVVIDFTPAPLIVPAIVVRRI